MCFNYSVEYLRCMCLELKPYEHSCAELVENKAQDCYKCRKNKTKANFCTFCIHNPINFGKGIDDNCLCWWESYNIIGSGEI